MEKSDYEKAQEEAAKYQQTQDGFGRDAYDKQQELLKQQAEQKRQQEQQDMLKKQQEQQQQQQQQPTPQQVQQNLESVPRDQRSPAYQQIVQSHDKIANMSPQEKQQENAQYMEGPNAPAPSGPNAPGGNRTSDDKRQPHQRDTQFAHLENDASRMAQRSYEARSELAAKNADWDKQLESGNLTDVEKKHIGLQRNAAQTEYDRDTANSASKVCGVVGDKENQVKFAKEYESKDKEHSAASKALDDYEKQHQLGKYAPEQENSKDPKDPKDPKNPNNALGNEQGKEQNKAQGQAPKTPDKANAIDTAADIMENRDAGKRELSNREKMQARQDQESAKNPCEVPQEQREKAQQTRSRIDAAREHQTHSREREKGHEQER